ncbi:OLC1v1038154C1 [Oldenlandia corymbosa var. corymbosa]|uniref:OLC1v1038154C1 n=1 Tax=Oldenlandia corymbosa var. corymbosa TaxID=529605 RepID=A0AAV1D293_OLDCO|nr:OLC1v1038154C1 [Oldenlandia corymbosa var. corymbosa]
MDAFRCCVHSTLGILSRNNQGVRAISECIRATCSQSLVPANNGTWFLGCKLRFDKGSGVLKISPLNVNDSTETFFRNLITFELSGASLMAMKFTRSESDPYGCYLKCITSYVTMLNNLIDTCKDVDLVQGGIIKNELGSSKQVAELYSEFVIDAREF